MLTIISRTGPQPAEGDNQELESGETANDGGTIFASLLPCFPASSHSAFTWRALNDINATRTAAENYPPRGQLNWEMRI
jgi:hypothetical protein